MTQPVSSNENPLTPVANTEELITNAALFKFNLVINTRIKAFICLTCQLAIHASTVKFHFQNHPKVTFGQDAIDMAAAAASQANLPPTYLQLTPTIDGVPSVDGLNIRLSNGCPRCPYTAQRKSVIKHLLHMHDDRTTKPITNLHSQLLGSGTTNTLFRVIPKDTPAVSEDLPPLVRQFLESIKPALDVVGSMPNARLINPWLQRSKFHFFLVNRKAVDLCHIVRPAGQDEFEGLKEAIFNYFHTATHKIDSTDELSLQRLDTDDPGKDGINNHPLSHHHQEETTLKTYVKPVVRLVTSLLRDPVDLYQFPQSPALEEAIVDLRKDVTSYENLHRLFLALWKGKWPGDSSGPITDPTICFLALYTLHPAGNFSEPPDVTPIIAKLTRAIRLAMLTEVHKMVERQEVATHSQALDVLSDFIHEKRLCTFNSLQSLQHYASTLAYNTMSHPRVVWIDTMKHQELLFDGHRISMDQIHNLFVQLEDDMIRIWEDDILLGEKIEPLLPPLVIADRLRNARPGYSFFDDPQNPFLERAADLGRLIVDKHLTIYIAATGATALDQVKARKWLHRLGELEGLLMVAAELKGGAPARGTEITSMLARNTGHRFRNLMAFSGLIGLVCQYNKTSNTMQSERLIPHALDSVTAHVFLLVHTFARPLAVHLAKILFPQGAALAEKYQSMLFMSFGREFTSTDLSQIMAEEPVRVLSWEMRISAWRHIQTAFKHKHCKHALANMSHQELHGIVQALQSGHSLSTENRVYGISQESMMGHSSEVFQLFMLTSFEWQVALRIVPGGLGLDYQSARASNFDQLSTTLPNFPKFPSSTTTAAPNSQFPLEEVKQLIDNHYTTLAGQLSAIKSEFGKRFDAAFDPPFSSTPNDTTLIDSSSLPPSSLPPPSGYAFSSCSDSSLPSSSPPPPTPTSSTSGTMSLLPFLAYMYGPGASWSCEEQRLAVEAVKECKRDLIVALRTGVGKTAIVVVPALSEETHTIVVCPLVALIEDWNRRLTEHKINFETFTSDMTSLEGQANIILATSDAIKSKNWPAAIRRLSLRRPVSRMVFDETHHWVTDQEFRQRVMQDPFLNRLVPMQFVLLSGTIPPTAESFLIKHFGLQHVQTIRHHSSRTEISYSRMPACEDYVEMIFHLRKLLVEHIQGWDEEDRYIIFTPYIQEGVKIASILDLEFYHAHSQNHPITNDQRREIYNNWVNGKKKGIVASNALAAGNDYKHVRLAVHLNNPYDLITFAQQSGRAGRDGFKAHSILFPCSKPPAPKKGRGEDLSGQAAMKLYCDPNQSSCLRYIMSGFLDGQAHTCADLQGAEICSNCTMNQSTSEPQQQTIQLPAKSTVDVRSSAFLPASAIKRRLEDAFGAASDEAQSRQRDLRLKRIKSTKTLLEFLQIIGNHCAYCFLSGTQPIGRHFGDKCPSLGDSKLRDQFTHDFRGGFHYELTSDPSRKVKVCFSCHVTRGDTTIDHPQFIRGAPKNDCPYPTVVPQVAFFIWNSPNAKKLAQQEFGISWTSLRDFGSWFTMKHSDPLYQSNGNALLAWFIKHVPT